MAQVDGLAAFAAGASWDLMSPEARQALKMRILDALGCALGALGTEPMRRVRAQVDDFGGRPVCALIGGGRTAPDRAAFHNGALVRYLDFNDSYLAPGETCHPSDSLGAVMAAAEYAGGTGRDLMAALAAAYQVQCRLSEAAPVRAKGFDHVTQLAYAAAAGVSRALALEPARAADAIAIAGTALNALRVTRTGALSHWKGLAAPFAAAAAAGAAFLAMRGITGPREVFEGNKGFIDTIAGRFEIDWPRENLELVRETVLKKYDAEVHSQSAIEGLLELRREHEFPPERIESIDVDIFAAAFHIIGGGEEGAKTSVRTKEEADHSLPYLLAVALLDGDVMPGQYAPERIAREDVQTLLRRVRVRPDPALSARFPKEHACRLRVVLRDGRRFEKEKRDYEGFHTRPMPWERVLSKFERLAERTDAGLRREIVEAVRRLEDIRVRDLTSLLEKVKP